MIEHESFLFRCRATIAELSEREGWSLTNAQMSAYAAQVVANVPSASLTSQLEQVVRYFHRDHKLYQALRDESSTDHLAAWAWVQREIIRTAQIKGLGWSRDRSVEVGDLAQTVQVEVARALPDYRFESSLRTWIQGITVRRLRRFHRDSLAAKRAVFPESLDAASEHLIEWHEFEPEVLARALLSEIVRVLNRSGDARYAKILHLHLIDDRSAQEIGERVKLHPSRVRALLKIALTLLKEDMTLREWYEGIAGDDSRHRA